MKTLICLLAAGVVMAGIANAAEPPLGGCYERIYDVAHLSQHKGQLVVRAALAVTSVAPEDEIDKADPLAAKGTLKFWVRGQKESFDSFGACRSAGAALLCGGSLSAAEADDCKSKKDGVRDCRIDATDAGLFKIEGRPEGVLVSIAPRLELVQAPYDAGPFLHLSARNVENRAFLLKKTTCQ